MNGTLRWRRRDAHDSAEPGEEALAAISRMRTPKSSRPSPALVLWPPAGDRFERWQASHGTARPLAQHRDSVEASAHRLVRRPANRPLSGARQAAGLGAEVATEV